MDDRTHKKPSEAESEAALAAYHDHWCERLEHTDPRAVLAILYAIARTIAKTQGGVQAIDELIEAAEAIAREHMEDPPNRPLGSKGRKIH
ncbi:hypothetical protein HKCCE3408_05100 [Rhodobacterales bacterium HKCCE3408]|nr:hypothetical protein [Rhodobacterales bacterium HKCCE3408]